MPHPSTDCARKQAGGIMPPLKTVSFYFRAGAQSSTF
jgi:hypothetical protein